MIARSILELKGYQLILNRYYQEHKSLPTVGFLFPNSPTPLNRLGCNIPGACPMYYERLQNDSNKAFISKTLSTIDKPNQIFVAFLATEQGISTYCGPWENNSVAHLQASMLPPDCHQALKELLGF